jgi:hypothetical protein
MVSAVFPEVTGNKNVVGLRAEAHDAGAVVRDEGVDGIIESCPRGAAEKGEPRKVLEGQMVHHGVFQVDAARKELTSVVACNHDGDAADVLVPQVVHMGRCACTTYQSAGIFRYKTSSQQKYSGTKYSVSRDIPVQNIQSAGIFQYTLFSQQGYFSSKYSISRDILVPNSQLVEIFPVPNSQLVGIFQYKVFSQQGYSSTKYSVSRDISVQNSQSVGIFQYQIFNQ